MTTICPSEKRRRRLTHSVGMVVVRAGRRCPLLRSGPEALDVAATPDANRLDEWPQRTSIVSERINDRGGSLPRPPALDNAVGDQLAQLLGQYLARDRRNETVKSQEVLRRFAEPMDDDEFPFAADGRESRREGAVTDLIRPARASHSYVQVRSCNDEGRQLFCHRRISVIRRHARTVALLFLFGLAIALKVVPALARDEPAPSSAVAQVAAPDGPNDFDFETGTWKARLSRLDKPLTRSTTWFEYEGTSVVRRVWGGRANLGELAVRGTAGQIEGLSLRLYNPQSRQWHISWANARDGMLGDPMSGGFKDGRGEFFGEELLNDRVILVRFVFFEIAANSFRFEQAFSDDWGKTWEVNWKATFTR